MGGGDETGEVVVETKQGMMVVEKQKASFVYDVHMNFRQMPLTRSKTQRCESLSHILCKIS